MGNTVCDGGRQSHRRRCVALERDERRIGAVALYRARDRGEEPVTELRRQSGISRKTGYKLIHRYEAHGEDGLLDRSRAPHYHPNATPRELAERIVEAKRAHPTWGPKSSSPGSERHQVAGCPGPLPAPRASSWPARGLCSGAAPPPRVALERALRPRHRAQRRLVHRLQRLVPHWRPDARRSPHCAGRDLSLPHRLPGLERPTGVGDAARVSARLHASTASPQVIRTDNGPPFAGVGRGQPLPPVHGGSSWVSSLSASPRAIPNRTGLERLHRMFKAETRRRPGPTGDGSGEPSSTSAQLQQRADPTRPWDSDRRSGSTPPRSGPIPHASTRRIRGRGHRAPSAPQRRDQVEGGQSLCERVSSGRAHRPRPARRSAPGRSLRPCSSSASSTTTRVGSTRPRYTCYLCPRSNRYPCARSHRGRADKRAARAPRPRASRSPRPAPSTPRRSARRTPPLQRRPGSACGSGRSRRRRRPTMAYRRRPA